MNRVRRRLLLAACASLILAAFVAQAAEFSSVIREFRQRVWTRHDGLPSDTVTSILQTRKGYLWIGMDSAVARFDGSKFTVFNQENSPISPYWSTTVMAEQNDGGLWIGFGYGLLLYKNGSFTRFTNQDGLWDDDVRALHVGRSGKVWIGTMEGASLYENGSLERLPRLDRALQDLRVHGLYEDDSGLLWICSESGVHKYHIATGEYEEVRHDGGRFHPKSMHKDATGAIWIGDHQQFFRSENSRWIRYPLPEDRPKVWVTSLLTEQAGSLWFVMSESQLGRFRDGRFTYFDYRDGLPSVGILRIFDDRNRNLWLATMEGGLVSWQPRLFTTYSTQDGIPDDDVRTIFESRDGGVWIGTEGGLCQFKEGRFTSYKREPGPQSIIRSIAQDSTGALWLGTLGAGVVCLRDGKFTDYPLPGDRYGSIVRSLAIGNDDSVWIGTGRGLCHLSQGRLTSVTTTNFMTENEEIWALHFDRAGNLWVGGVGVARVSAAALQAVAPDFAATGSGRPDALQFPTREITLFTTTNGLSQVSNWAFHEDQDGVIWVGNGGGLNRLKDGHILVFTKQEGLPDNRIEEILEDDVGNLWIASEREIFRVPRAELNDVAEGRARSVRCITYGERDTLPDTRINGRKSHPAGCKTRDGRLWLPTTNGVVVFNPKTFMDQDTPPTVILESVRANGAVIFGDLDAEGKPVARSQRSGVSGQSRGGETPGSALSPPSAGVHPQSQIRNQKSEIPIRLPAADARVLEFDYTACDLVAAEKVRFKYRLEGFDAAWVDAGTRRRAFYSNLRPGNYRFQVLACNHNGVWNESGASLAFRLAPHYSETGWFQFGAGLSALLIFALISWGIHHWRLGFTRRIHELETQQALAQERRRIARDLHDEIGSQLTQIAISQETESSKKSATQPPPPAFLARRALRSLDEVVWATDPQQDKLERLVDYIGRSAREYLQGTEASLRLDVPTLIPDESLRAGARHNIVLAIKEALANAIKHTGATEITLRFQAGDAGWSLGVQDDGRGFNVDEALESGNGLHNMRERVEETGGQFRVTSQPKQGTLVLLEWPWEERPRKIPR